MTEPKPDTAARLIAAVADLHRFGGNDSSSRSEIHINAGGLGVWVATTACIAMLCMMIVGAFWVSSAFNDAKQERVELRQDVNTNKAFVSAIYQIAPQLKPKDDEPKEESK